MSKPHTTLVLPDVHCPWQNVRLLKRVLQLARDIKPQRLILSGDFLDLYTLSRHNEQSLYKLRDLTLDYEYGIGLGVLQEIVGAVGRGCGERYFLFGNHEDNHRRYLEKSDNAKTGTQLTSPQEALRLEDLGFEVHTNWMDDTVSIGDHLDVTHGVSTCKHSAAKHMDEFEGSVMFGHTHRFNTFVHGKRGGYNIGWLGDRDSKGFSYAPRTQRMKWCNGFGVVYLLDDGSFVPQPVQCWNDRFVFNGKLY